MADVVLSCVPSVLQTEEGMQLAKRITRERWYVYMISTRNRTFNKLGASLAIVGVLQELEPWRFLQPNAKDRKKIAISSYDARQKRLQELHERVSHIR